MVGSLIDVILLFLATIRMLERGVDRKPRAQLPEVGTMIWLIELHCNDLDLNYLVGVSLIEILLHLGPSN